MYHSGSGKPTFEIEKTKWRSAWVSMVNGNPPGELQPADEVTMRLMDKIIADFPLESGQK